MLVLLLGDYYSFNKINCFLVLLQNSTFSFHSSVLYQFLSRVPRFSLFLNIEEVMVEEEIRAIDIVLMEPEVNA